MRRIGFLTIGCAAVLPIAHGISGAAQHDVDVEFGQPPLASLQPPVLPKLTEAELPTLDLGDEEELSVPRMLCSDWIVPRLAVCIHGSARSFPHPLIHRSLKRNLIDSLGARSTTFLHLTRLDARADERKDKGGTFPEVSEKAILVAAETMGVPSSRIKLSEGPNAPLPTCSETYDSGFGHRVTNSDRGTKHYLYSLAGQLSHREGCMQMIREEEVRTGNQFDAVLLARADMTAYDAMRPFCMYNFDLPRRFWDWIYLAPRSKTDALFSDPYHMFYNCTHKLSEVGSVEDWMAEAWKRTQVATVSDESLPVMVTRLDHNNMPSVNICNRFKNKGALPMDPPGGDKLCKAVTYQNRYNTLMDAV